VSAKRTASATHGSGVEMYADGHTLLNGARWHYPAPGRPTACAIPGCDRLLGQQVTEDDLVEDTDSVPE
jgi:hypothetical protein